jgi:hypothetical protein
MMKSFFIRYIYIYIYISMQAVGELSLQELL